ncbi:MAG TPA: protein kinase [Ktedonobacterales bacterium]
MDVEILGDRYDLQGPVGRGGMATIYRAVDLRMGRTVAVKILREAYSNDPKFVTRFQREARAASMLQHPNIVQVFDYGQSGEAYYIVMEFIEGTDLRQYLKRSGRLSNERAVIIAHDVALGLGAAHKRGIVHRDVKPQNILLNDDGLVKLTDFGIASVYKGADAERLTTTGMTLGTVQYYAPEQAQGEIVSPAADVYAMGIVMYEMVAGRTPFDGDTPVAVAMRHIQDIPEPPSRYNPNIHPNFERIIMRCLEKDPRDRYRDGDSLAYALENYERQPVRPSGNSNPRMGAGGDRNGYGPPGRPARVSGAPMRGPSGPSPVYDVPGMAPGMITRPHGPAAGTLPRSPSSGYTSGPNGVPFRPDADGGDAEGKRTGPIVAVAVVGVLVLLGISCFLAFSLANIGNPLTGLLGPAPTVTTVPTVAPTNTVSTTPSATGSPTPFALPNLVGLGASVVTQTCNTDHLTCINMGSVQSSKPFGTVAQTNPIAGTPVTPNQQIQYWLSLGPTPTPTNTATPTPTATATPSVSPDPTGGPNPPGGPGGGGTGTGTGGGGTGQ